MTYRYAGGGETLSAACRLWRWYRSPNRSTSRIELGSYFMARFITLFAAMTFLLIVSYQVQDQEARRAPETTITNPRLP